MEAFLQEANNKLQTVLDHVKRELSSIRAGRANPAMIEDLAVLAYGGRMKLIELSTIASPQPSLLTIQVWDVSLIPAIEKAILESSLGLTPSTEAQTIRLSIPPLSEERRIEFVKLAHQKGEEARISVRQIRADERQIWNSELESGKIGDDELARREKLLQDLVDSLSVNIQQLVKAKEEELLSI